MFIIDSKNEIVLQTRKGTSIPNWQSREISQYNQNLFNIIRTKYSRAEIRTKPSGIYNCHGMTFANRRCFVEDGKQVQIILNEDDYEAVAISDVLPGDIIVYFSGGDAEHSGIVIEKPKHPLFVPLIISKWASHAEFIHYANYCPYDCTNIKFFRIME